MPATEKILKSIMFVLPSDNRSGKNQTKEVKAVICSVRKRWGKRIDMDLGAEQAYKIT